MISKYSVGGTLERLRDELASIKSKALGIHSSLESLLSEAEMIKILVIEFYIEKQKQAASRDKGITSLFQDKRRVRDSLIVAAGSFVFGGLLTKNKFQALSAGLSGFDGMVQGFGETRWCVLIGNKISVVPEGAISAKVPWITLANFYRAIEELKRRALAGVKLGNLDGVISKLMKICSISNN